MRHNGPLFVQARGKMSRMPIALVDSEGCWRLRSGEATKIVLQDATRALGKILPREIWVILALELPDPFDYASYGARVLVFKLLANISRKPKGLILVCRESALK